MKKIISFILVITFIFQFNTISVLAEEINKSKETNNTIEEKKETLVGENKNYSTNNTEENEKVDNEDPKLNSVTANKTSVKPGDELKITVDASDDTGINRVYGYIYIGDDWNYIEFQYDKTTKKYTYTLAITDDMKYKKIKLSEIDIEDLSEKK